MKVGKLDDMTKGWFVGNFEPSVLRTNAVEVAVKKYSEGDFELPKPLITVHEINGEEPRRNDSRKYKEVC